jgi:predicted amidohydrolase
VLFNRDGKIAGLYRKIHLFEALLNSKQKIAESDVFTRGSNPVTVNIEGWVAGLSICYDLRFPELYRQYSKAGAHILFVPSNFTQRTGKDHWEILVRARAIENQCFVIAPNQCGKNEATKIQSYGHSMIVGPWGEILAKASNHETILTVCLNKDDIENTRHRIPALKHRIL